MNGEVQLIVTAGSTGYSTSGPYTTAFNPAGGTVANIADIGNPPANLITIGTIITGPNGGLVTTSTVVAFDPNTGDITFDAYLDYSNISPTPVSQDIYIDTLVDTFTQSYIDLYENESISQNWKFQDLSNFTAQGAFSREFRVPFSENNQLALGALFDVNVTAGTANYFHYKLNAEIRVDTLPIATGYVRVRKVYRQSNRINEVELAFYAETPDLVRNIGEKKLKDITDLTNLDEVVSYQNVTNPNATRIWTLCDRGQIWSEGGEVNSRSLLTAATPVWPSDLTPSLRYDYLLEKIFEDAGFELVGGTLLTTLSNYYMPWLNSSNIIGTDSFNNYLFTAYNSASLLLTTSSATVSVNTEIFDNNGDFNTATFAYTTPSGGYYTFRFRNKFTVAGQINNVSYFLEIDGIDVFLENYNVFNNQIVDFTYRIGIDAGSVVKFKIKSNNTTPAVTLVAGDGTYETSVFEVIKTEFLYGQSIIYNFNAPDAKQIDFVTDIIKMHNCAIVPDRAIPNKVYVVPQNSYLGSGNVLDWTSKLDASKDMTISSTVDLQKAKFQFTYSAGEDNLSVQYKNVNRVYGDYEAVGYTTNPNTEPSDFAIGDQKIQLVTQSTPCGPINGSGVIMPIFLNRELQFQLPGMRCLFDAGSTNIQLYDDNLATAVLTSVSLLNHYSQINADIDDEDLNWAPEIPAYSIVSNPYNNLFNQYWRTYMNALYSPEARIMEASFALDLKDILTFQFSDKIWIQDSWWRILEINDYKVGMNESTSVKLIKLIENTEDCSSTPVSISVNGEVNFEDGNGDPVASTQDCCQRYGYNWDEANAVCWAFVPNVERPSTGVSGNPTSPASRPTQAAVENRSILDSVVSGTDVTIAVGNTNMLAVGSRLELTQDVGGSNLLGKNTYTSLPGVHLGGGYKDGLTTSVEKGWAQHGIVVLHRKDSWLTSGTNLAYYVEGIAGEYMNIPDETVWSVLLNVTIIDAGNNYYTGQFSLAMRKVAGVATVSAITAINQINNTAYTFTMGVNVAANPAEHRLYLNVAGGGTFPANLITTASIQYQHSKIS